MVKIPEEVKQMQLQMAAKVSTFDDLPKKIRYVAGMDVSCLPFDAEQMIYAAGVLLDFDTLIKREEAGYYCKQTFPYIPGYLAFREAPALLKASSKLSIRPDLILVDGHGICHPKGVGIASHIGVSLDIPTIGVGKSILVGVPKHPLGEEVGSQSALYWQEKRVAMLLRSKKGCTPIVISSGHKISLDSAVRCVLHCMRKGRLPEPTRLAHQAANALRKGATSACPQLAMHWQ